MDNFDIIFNDEMNRIITPTIDEKLDRHTAGALAAAGLTLGSLGAGLHHKHSNIDHTVRDIPVRQKYIPNPDPVPEFLDQEVKKSSFQSKSLQTIAKTLYGEARGEEHDGIRAVATVIYNLADGNKDRFAEICKRPYLFSCWNGKKDIVIKEMQRYSICLKIAEEMLIGTFDPYPFENIIPTNYCTLEMYRHNPPHWARGQHGKEIVGRHVFFDLKKKHQHKK